MSGLPPRADIAAAKDTRPFGEGQTLASGRLSECPGSLAYKSGHTPIRGRRRRSNRRPRPLVGVLHLRSDVDLLRDLYRIIDLNAGAFDPCMAEQELDGSQIASASVDAALPSCDARSACRIWRGQARY